MLLRGADIPALLIALAAGGAWYMAATRLMLRLGTDEAAPVVGVFAGLAVAVSLWRRTVEESRRERLERLQCPRCASVLVVEHEHASAGQPAGLQSWACAACGYAHAEALTCEACRP